MITNLPAAFETELVKTSRQPIQLCEMHLPGIVHYLSDIPVGIADGLDNDYSPWVESWNSLNDSVSVNAVLAGGSLEIRSGTLTLINSPASRLFIQELYNVGIENVRVFLYQWFSGLSEAEKVLIDIMVCQDPIALSEASMLMSVDLVSVLLQNNPYLWSQATGEIRYDIVIGKAYGVPLIDLQTTRVTSLVQDIVSTDVGNIVIQNGIGFPGSGQLYIDSELINYSSITATEVYVTSRGVGGTTANAHYNGALITIPGGVYDYAVCAGPINELSNLQADGAAYPNDYTFLADQNPVIVRFYNRPPWLKIALSAGVPYQPPETTTTGYAEATEVDSRDAPFFVPTSPARINREDGYGAMTMFYRPDWTPTYESYTHTPNPVVNTYFNCFYAPYDSTKIRWTAIDGPSTGTYLAAQRNNSVDYCYDGVVGWCQLNYGQDNGDLGALVEVIPSFYYYRDVWCRVIRTDATLVITWESGAGSVELFRETIYNYDSDTPIYWDLPFGWVTFDAQEANGFSDLVTSGLRFEITCIRQNPNFGAVADIRLSTRGGVRFEAVYIPGAATLNQWQDLVAHYRKDLSNIGTLVSATATISIRNVWKNFIEASSIETVSRSTSDPIDNNSFENVDLLYTDRDVIFGPYDLGVSTFQELADTRVGVHSVITEVSENPINTPFLFVNVNWVKWDIVYLPSEQATADEERIVYAEKVTVDATSVLGEDPTPAKVLQYMLEDLSPNGQFVDTDSFDARHQEYLLDQYFLNGMIQGKYRLHDGLRQVLKEGMARFLFNEGKIKLLTYVTADDDTTDKDITLPDTLLRSRSIHNQPISLIKNNVSVIFDKDLSEDGVFNGETTQISDYSTEKYQVQEIREEYDLIHSNVIAELIAYRTLSLYENPVSVYKISVFMPVGYVIEKGDRISIPSFIDDNNPLIGNVVTVKRTFGSGKNKKINTYEIQIITDSAAASAGPGYGVNEYGFFGYGE